MAYLLDTNVLIGAKNLHYGMDFCPAFWDWLADAHQARKVYSVEKVRDEIRDDDLVAWASTLGGDFYLPADARVLPALGRVSEWVTGQRYTPAAINVFLQVADYYLIAQALAGRHVVVTHEAAENRPGIVKIPVVCLGLGVKCMRPFEMLRHERARFVLG